MRYLVFLLFLVIFLAGGCNNVGNAVNQKKFYENNIKTQVYFCPQDDCSSTIKNNINAAKISVHCAFFDLDLKGLIKEIGEKSQEADVKVVIDDGNYDGQIKGVGVRVAKSRQYMHNKFCVIDNNKVITGSMNPTERGSKFNNNNLLIINSKYIAENYENEFDELWNNIYASGDNVKYNKINTNIGIIENYFCPEDCKLDSQGGIFKIIDLVKNAEESVKVASFSFNKEIKLLRL